MNSHEWKCTLHDVLKFFMISSDMDTLHLRNRCLASSWVFLEEIIPCLCCYGIEFCAGDITFSVTCQGTADDMYLFGFLITFHNFYIFLWVFMLFSQSIHELANKLEHISYTSISFYVSILIILWCIFLAVIPCKLFCFLWKVSFYFTCS